MNTGESQTRQALRKLIDDRRISEEAEQLSCSLGKFVKAAWPEIKPEVPYMHNWHIDVICDYLESVSRGELKRLQIWIPPQSMKSLLASVSWPAWEWTFAPGMSYWTASYSTDLSGRLSAMSMGLMKTRWYQERWGSRFTFIRDAEHFFANDRGGHRLATSPGAETGTGYHGDRILIDDAINARSADALSKVVLETANDWYDSTVSSRGIGPNHARVIIMQRLHENDIAAHVLELEDWEVLCLPERFEPEHPFAWRRDTRKENELLWPDYRPPEMSDSQARSLRHRAAGQMQQRPAPREGQILKRNWWRFYRPEIMEDDRRRPKLTAVVQSVDTPLKDKESNDYVALQAWGIKGADRYLLDIRKDRMNYNQCKRAVLEQARYVRRIFPSCAHYVLIENAGYGPELISDLKRELTGTTKINPTQEGDKVMRAESASDALESGNCWLPGIGAGADETLGPVRSASAAVTDFIESCAVFPNAAHDDDVDAWSQAMNWTRARILRRGRTYTPFARGTRAA